MAGEVYGFDESTVEKIARVVRSVLAKDKRTRPQRRRKNAIPAAIGLKLAKLSTNLASMGFATARIWTADAGTETDSGTDVTVYDWLIPSGQQIVANSHIIIGRIDGHWYLINGQCPTTV